MRNLKKSLFATLILALVLSPIFAIQVMNVTWQWSLDDKDVTAYRYQLNSESDAGWTVVGGDVSEYNATSLDPYTDYTLYLQASYDGSVWSESAVSTAKAMLTRPVALEDTIDVFGNKVTIRVYDSSIEIVYPASAVTPNDAKSFLDYVNGKYSDYLAGTTYEISEGETVLTLPVAMNEEDKPAVIAIFKAEVNNYIASLTAPVATEPAPAVSEKSKTETPADVESAPDVVAPTEKRAVANIVAVPEPKSEAKAKYSKFRFSMIPTLGAEYRFDNFSSFEKDNIYPRASIAFDFANIIPMGRHFGLGLRSDISVGLIPQNGYSAFDSFKSIFKGDNWMEDTTADLKLTATVSTKSFNFYLGGGVGYSIINPKVEGLYETQYGHSLGTLTSYFSTAWGPTGVIGMRLYMGKLFSLGLEGNYRYLLPADKHYVSANLAFGFTF